MVSIVLIWWLTSALGRYKQTKQAGRESSVDGEPTLLSKIKEEYYNIIDSLSPNRVRIPVNVFFPLLFPLRDIIPLCWWFGRPSIG